MGSRPSAPPLTRTAPARGDFLIGDRAADATAHGILIEDVFENLPDLDDVAFKSNTDSLTAFQVNDNDGGVPVLNVDTINERVGVGTALPLAQVDIRGLAGSPGALLIATDELTNVDGDILGRIDFQAPLDSAGTDAILVAASIWAEANDTFAADNNKTELVFATAVSEVATEKMRLTSNGRLGIGTEAPDGSLHVHAATAGVVTANTGGDDLVVEGAVAPGASFLGPDDQTISLFLGSPTQNRGLTVSWNHDADLAIIGTRSVGADIQFNSGNAVQAALLSSGGDLTLNTGKLIIANGNAVTQLTSITTSVTVNRDTCQITTVLSTLGAGVDASFTVTNNTVLANDCVIVNTLTYGGTADGIPICKCQSVAAGSFVINIHNQGAVALDAVIVLQFIVIGGSN